MHRVSLASAPPLGVSHPRNIPECDVEHIARLPLFAGLCRASLERVIGEAVTARFPHGSTIIHQGATAEYLHILLDGQVGLMGTLSDGEETMVEILREGEAFIAAAVLTGRPYLMGAVALSDCRMLLIPAEGLRRDLRGDPDLALALLASLSTRYRMLVREIKDLKLKSAAQRLGLYLLGLTTRRDGLGILRLPHSKGIIAARIGIRAETLSRAFASLKAEGVAVNGHTVTVADLGRLSRFCMEGEEPV